MGYVVPSIQASGATWANLLTGGLTKVLDLQIAANTTITNPSTQITVSATGGGASGGTLPAGTYYATCTHTNCIGETTAGTTRSASFTISLGNKPRITVPALPTGAVATNIYLTAAGGASGTEVLYATGITGTTYDATTSTFVDSARSAPTTNTTALSGAAPLLNTGRAMLLQNEYLAANRLISNFIAGRPMALSEVMAGLARHAAVFQCLATALNEINVLVHANTGTLTTAANAAGERVPVRTFS